MSIAARKVKSLRTHASMHIPNWGELGNTLPPASKNLNLSMELGEHGVICEGGPAHARQTVLVPYGNISTLLLAPEEAAAPVAAKAK